MQNAPQRLEELYNLWTAGQLSVSQQAEFFDLLEANDADRSLDMLMKQEWLTAQDEQTFSIKERHALAEKILRSHEQRPKVHLLKTTWLRYAAVLLLIAGSATFLYQAYRNQPENITGTPKPFQQPDIQPGGNKAILTLSDGSRIVLDSAGNGDLAQQGGTKILKLNAGSLSYSSQGTEGTAGLNTITIPRGGQYQVMLPDGSKAWLNSSSSITFPTAFGKEREVSVTGEAYFEIAADKKKPFKVTANGMAIDVLGTSFNVNTYADEPVPAVTLLNGSIQVTASGKKAVMKPGTQALIVSQDIKVIRDADAEKAIAWKNGRFSFSASDISSIMRQVSRWYNVDVVFKTSVNDFYTFEMSRDQPLSALLENLSIVSRIKFSLNGNVITVHQ